jgi:hypothetical protein
VKKSAAVGVKIVSAVSSLALTLGCGTRPTHQKVCGDNQSFAIEPEKCVEEERKQEEARRGAHPYVPLYRWHYGPYGKSYPPGSRLTEFSRDVPSGHGVRIAEPVRGGFGSSARPQFGG